jgi:hypothetical protein
MGEYMGVEFRVGESDDIKGPDLPMGRYPGRRFYDGENTGEGVFPAVPVEVL